MTPLTAHYCANKVETMDTGKVYPRFLGVSAPMRQDSVVLLPGIPIASAPLSYIIGQAGTQRPGQMIITLSFSPHSFEFHPLLLLLLFQLLPPLYYRCREIVVRTPCTNFKRVFRQLNRCSRMNCILQMPLILVIPPIPAAAFLIILYSDMCEGIER